MFTIKQLTLCALIAPVATLCIALFGRISIYTKRDKKCAYQFVGPLLPMAPVGQM